MVRGGFHAKGNQQQHHISRNQRGKLDFFENLFHFGVDFFVMFA